MIGKPQVMTRLGPGILHKIQRDNALVEFEYTYLVEIPLKEIDLRGVDLSQVDVEKTDICSKSVGNTGKIRLNGFMSKIMSLMAGIFIFLSNNRIMRARFKTH